MGSVATPGGYNDGMLGSYPIVAFVLTTDPARARQFYGETLGLTFKGEDGHAVVFEAQGALLRITIMREHKASAHTVLGWNVPDVAAVVRELSAAGVAFERYSFLPQDELGIWTTPDGSSKVAWFKDPDGNVLSVSQH